MMMLITFFCFTINDPWPERGDCCCSQGGCWLHEKLASLRFYNKGNHKSCQFPDQTLEKKEMEAGCGCVNLNSILSYQLNIGSGGIINLTLTQDIWSEHNNWDLIYYLSLFGFQTLRPKYLSLCLLSASCLSPISLSSDLFPRLYWKSRGSV